MAENTAARAATTALIICQEFGGFGRPGGSRSRLVPCKRYLWLSILDSHYTRVADAALSRGVYTCRMQAGYALIEFNYERPTIGDIVEVWNDEAAIRTLAKDSKGIIHTMFCEDILRTVIPP